MSFCELRGRQTTGLLQKLIGISVVDLLFVAHLSPPADVNLSSA
ncbi:MAG: hypothetical protein ACMG6S_05490 [Byssovorax sp.]